MQEREAARAEKRRLKEEREEAKWEWHWGWTRHWDFGWDRKKIDWECWVAKEGWRGADWKNSGASGSTDAHVGAAWGQSGAAESNNSQDLSSSCPSATTVELLAAAAADWRASAAAITQLLPQVRKKISLRFRTTPMADQEDHRQIPTTRGRRRSMTMVTPPKGRRDVSRWRNRAKKHQKSSNKMRHQRKMTQDQDVLLLRRIPKRTFVKTDCAHARIITS